MKTAQHRKYSHVDVMVKAAGRTRTPLEKEGSDDCKWMDSSAVNDSNPDYNDFFAETTRDDGSGTDIYAAIAITLYQQSVINVPINGDAAAYIRSYGTSSHAFVDLVPSAVNNGYYVNDCAYVQFRLITRFAFAIANAMTLPLDGNTTQSKIVNRHFILRDSGGRDLNHVRFALRATNSRLDVPGIVRRMEESSASHHKLARQSVSSHEVNNYRPAGPPSMVLL